MNGESISPLRRRMIEDMTVRKFVEKTQKDYIRHVKGLTSFLGRSPDTATAEDLRRYQLRAHDVPMASHDDMTPDVQAGYFALGCRICEFPFDRATAQAALNRGAYTVLGAPNVVRGGSHAARLGGREAVAEKLCSVLTSDYYYPTLMAAAFALVDLDLIDLSGAWRLVSTNAADAVGLSDRGRIAPGQRADLLLVEWQAGRLPRLAATFVEGEAVFAADNPLRMTA